MSTSRTLLRGIGALGITAAALAASAGWAGAAQKTLTYSCTYPYVGAQPLSVDINAALPESAPAGQPAGPYDVTAVATASGDTSTAVSIIGAKTIEGTATAGATVATAAQSAPLTVPVTIPAQAVAPTGDLVLNASGSTPPVTIDQPGTAKVTVDSLALNLLARNANGEAIQLEQSGTDSDGNPDTFDVPCDLAPTGQDTTLGTVTVS